VRTFLDDVEEDIPCAGEKDVHENKLANTLEVLTTEGLSNALAERLLNLDNVDALDLLYSRSCVSFFFSFSSFGGSYFTVPLI
jgi:hypothetical protein